MIPTWLALARAVHFAACLLILATCVFDRFIAEGPRWRSVARWLCFIALPLALASGVVWLLQVTISMSGEAISDSDLQLVWNQTQFGFVWRLRLFIWIGLAAAVSWAFVPGRTRPTPAWLALVFSAALVGSLAWSGHGQYGRPIALHLACDAVHLIVAGCWPAGLVPLALVLFRSGQAPIHIVRRFSAMSLTSVALLTLSGTINSWYMLGSVQGLWTTYGRVLMVKVAVFLAMVGFGAVNLLRLKPKLESDARAGVRLRWNAAVEGVLFAVVIAVVSVLGLLMPPMP
jgi:putative copper resistance protein D